MTFVNQIRKLRIVEDSSSIENNDGVNALKISSLQQEQQK
jgi:hypothetical protein